MRGAFYDNVTGGVVGAVTRRMPGFVAGILEDYEYLWENYYFSTSAGRERANVPPGTRSDDSPIRQ
ncbi:hypothetical protein H633G_10032 [Metarhizium anisopliae BRIP 53284]|nr:hypothetical protein H633G_10032 [Metarhizium anisopliae BRIP 53284]